MKTVIGKMGVKYSARGIASCEIELSHKGLHKHRVVRGPDSTIVRRKASVQAAAWDEAWHKRASIDRTRKENAEAKGLALERTREAQGIQEELRKILLRTLEI